MKFKTLVPLGFLTAEAIVEIPNDLVTVEQVVDAQGAATLRVDVSRAVGMPIPEDAVATVVIKNNYLYERTALPLGGGTWGKVKAAADAPVAVSVGKELSPSKTEIHLVFTRPGDSKIVGTTGAMRLRDDEVMVWQGGVSFFRTKQVRANKRPVTAIMDEEGPMFHFGPLGPKSGTASEKDFHFVAVAAVAGVEKFVTHLLLAEEFEFQGKYWDGFRERVAQVMGKKNFREIRAMQHSRSVSVEEIALECADAFFNDKQFYAYIRKLYAEQVSNSAEEQE